MTEADGDYVIYGVLVPNCAIHAHALLGYVRRKVSRIAPKSVMVREDSEGEYMLIGVLCNFNEYHIATLDPHKVFAVDARLTEFAKRRYYYVCSSSEKASSKCTNTNTNTNTNNFLGLRHYGCTSTK